MTVLVTSNVNDRLNKKLYVSLFSLVSLGSTTIRYGATHINPGLEKKALKSNFMF